MNLHINDANILIDIVHLDLVEAFLALDFDLHTTDFVFAELDAAKQSAFSRKQLNILIPSAHDIQTIFEYSTEYKGLSIEDCSVLHFAEKLNGILITGDGKLRKTAKGRQIEVRGIIYILEQIKIQKLLNPILCVQKLEQLKAINSRLPFADIDSLVTKWNDELTNNP